MSTETTEVRNFLGIQVTGDISKGETRVDQKPLSELEPLIRAVLDDPYIREFGWDQYTPYFNDGDPCIFRVGTSWFLTVDDPERDDIDETYDYSMDTEHPTLGRHGERWNGMARKYEDLGYQGSRPEEYARVRALSRALESGAFEHVLIEAFGDHAEVTVRRDGIQVDFYSHD